MITLDSPIKSANDRGVNSNYAGGEKGMDTKSLKYFLYVAEHRNFTKAAAQLYITQSALSHHIAELEKELSTKLFLRTTRSVNLTPSGEILYKSAKDLMAHFDQISDDIRKADSGLSGELVIGHLISPLNDFLPDVTKNFLVAYPDIKIRYDQKSPGPLMKSFSQDEVDVAFVMSFDVEGKADVEWEPLYTDRMSIAVRSDHPLAATLTLDYQKLAGERFIFTTDTASPNWNRQVLKVCAARGFVPNIITRADRAESILFDVKAGLGIAIIPFNSARHNTHDLHFCEMEGEDTKFSEVVAWKKDCRNPIVPFFLAMLKENGNASYSG
jgi:DNA-binding transcriptional LysR family regulator